MLPIPINDMNKNNVLDEMTQEVDDVIVQSVTAGDPLIACNYGNRLRDQAAVRGLALAKLLYEMKQNWSFYVAAGTDDDFENVIEANMGIVPQTTRKYSEMWQSIFASDYVSPEIKQKLQTKPIQELLLLTSAVAEGSLSDDELETIAVSDKSKTREIVRKARGQQTSSKAALYGAIQMTDGKYPRGTLLATKDGVTEIVGYLNLDLPEESHGHQLIARIRNSSGLMERG